MQTIGIYAPSVHHFTETLAYWLSLNPQVKVLLITSTDFNPQQVGEHPWCIQRINPQKNITLVPFDTRAQPLDWLLIDCSPNPPAHVTSLIQWTSKAENICLLADSRHATWRTSLKALLFYFPYWLIAKAVILQGSQQGSNTYPFIKNRFFYPPSAHPQILWNDDLLKKFLSETQLADSKRRFKFVFIGNRNPPERLVVLKQVKNSLNQVESLTYVNHYPVADDALDVTSKTAILWIEYGDHEPVRGVSPSDYIDALAEADFCISPSGWGGNWTHRTVEALFRGSIPILEDEAKYNVGLEDLKTCIAVKQSNWSEAIHRARSLTPAQIGEMRCEIRSLCQKHLFPEIVSLRLTTKLRINKNQPNES